MADKQSLQMIRKLMFRLLPIQIMLAPRLGIRGICLANVLNGITLDLLIFGYAWMRKKHFPRTMDELMVIPKGFGVPEEDRIDISVRTTDEVVTLAERIQHFCQEKGIDEKRSYLADLCMEEMAGNVVEHGFIKDKKIIRQISGSYTRMAGSFFASRMTAFRLIRKPDTVFWKTRTQIKTSGSAWFTA